MIDRLLHWRWCFGEHAAIKLVNDAANLPMCAEEKVVCPALEKKLM
ncbi:hypothetical protein [Bradyrhizobium zhanjiangense]|nr:hypothetical protein [Bradyrhizobium zhanjiangense]